MLLQVATIEYYFADVHEQGSDYSAVCYPTQALYNLHAFVHYVKTFVYSVWQTPVVLKISLLAPVLLKETLSRVAPDN